MRIIILVFILCFIGCSPLAPDKSAFEKYQEWIVGSYTDLGVKYQVGPAANPKWIYPQFVKFTDDAVYIFREEWVADNSGGMHYLMTDVTKGYINYTGWSKSDYLIIESCTQQINMSTGTPIRDNCNLQTWDFLAFSCDSTVYKFGLCLSSTCDDGHFGEPLYLRKLSESAMQDKLNKWLY